MRQRSGRRWCPGRRRTTSQAARRAALRERRPARHPPSPREVSPACPASAHGAALDAPGSKGTLPAKRSDHVGPRHQTPDARRHERKRGRPVTPHAVMADDERADALEALRAELPATSFVDDPDTIAARSVDASFIPPEGRPLALIVPASTEEVSAVLRIANSCRIPVVPQGGLTGLAGGASAVEGAVLLDLSRMDKVLRVDPVDQVDAQHLVYPGEVEQD